MRDGFDCSELMDFAERLGAQPKEMLKAQKKMLRTSGTKLRRKTAQRARADVRRTYQAGKKVFAKAAEEFEPEFESAAEDMVDELIDKI